MEEKIEDWILKALEDGLCYRNDFVRNKLVETVKEIKRLRQVEEDLEDEIRAINEYE